MIWGMVAHESTSDMIAEYEIRFARRIKEVRGKRGLSAQKLADISGLDRRVISKIENGDRGCSVGEAIALADALDLRDVAVLCKAAPLRLHFEVSVD